MEMIETFFAGRYKAQLRAKIQERSALFSYLWHCLLAKRHKWPYAVFPLGSSRRKTH